MVGAAAELTQIVTREMCADRVGSGTVAVFATPELVLLLEKAAVAAVASHLDEGTTTVGSGLDLTHLAATPPGMAVTATAKVIDLEGRKITFEVTASDEVEAIANGTHTRYIVAAQSFQSSADAKLAGEDN